MRRSTVIVALNLTFDYFMCMLFDRLKLQSYAAYKIRTLNDPSFAYFSKKINYYEVQEGDQSIYYDYKSQIPTGSKAKKKQKTIRLQFTDLANYFLYKPSLQEIAKSFEIEGKFNSQSMFTFNLLHYLKDYMTDFIDDYIKAFIDMETYCSQDSQIAKECLEIIFSDNPFDIPFRFTISSLGFTVLKEMTGWKTFERPVHVRKIERKSIFGGRSGNNEGYKGFAIKGYKYDIHSMYGYIQSIMKVPVEYLEDEYKSMYKGDYDEYDQYDIIRDLYNSDDRQALIKAKIRMLKPVLPYKKIDVDKNEKLFFDQGVILTGYWCIDEFFPAWRDHEIEVFKVTQIFVYRAIRGLFKPFVDYYYNQKLNAPKDSPAYNKAKLVLNGAAFGKFIERKRREINPSLISGIPEENLIDLISYQFEGVPEYLRFGSVDIITVSGSHLEIEVQGQDYHITEVLDQETWGACSIVGLIIPAMARRMLWEEGLRDNDPIQWDTDGVVLTHKINPELLHPTKLGAWELEKCLPNKKRDWCYYVSYRKKDYRCLHGIKLKGVPKIDIMGKLVVTPETHDLGKWKYATVTRPREAKRLKLKPFSIREVTKERRN